MQEKEREAAFLLCNIKGIGPVSIRQLIGEAGSAEKALNLPRLTLVSLLGEKRADCLEKGLEEKNRKAVWERRTRYQEKGIFFLPYWEEGYPGRLKQIPDAPVFLYGKGKLPSEEKKAVAIIGARECSGYGREAARYFAGGLAKAGVTVVSGMARGVDGIAGEAAMEAGGSSAAVLGCGVEVCYPPENRRLYERLQKEGCLLSEYMPDTGPDARLFPKRNRIISGLSDMVLVIEAREKSGTLITVDMALEQGRDVYAVPGRITDFCSRGCNRLIVSGAGMAVSINQLLSELELCDAKKAPDIPEKKSCARPLGQRVLEVLRFNPGSLDEIRQSLAGQQNGPALQELMVEMTLLTMEGAVENHAGVYELK